MLLRNGKIEMIGDPEKVGNEYIYQNMSDEEKRIVDEEKRNRMKAEKGLENMKGKEREGESHQNGDLPKRQEEEKRNKVAEITKVEFLDKNGNSKNVFETGENLSIKVYFKKNRPVDVLNFSIAIFNQENHYAFGTHTFSEKIDAKKCIDRGYYQVDYKDIPLRTNTYYINSAIYGKSDRTAYDFIPKSKFFKVFSKDKNYGMMDIDYVWS